ncbi:MAG: hypothetical protein K2O88_08695, partial [Paramuribaculum sp.]|nr:hypothetical protein [Paramuribaculum sp.]
MISEIQSLDNNAIQRLKTFREVLNECLPILTETGKSIQDKFLGKRVPYWAIFCHDVIKRLLEISHFICSSNPPQTGTCIPLKLCLRNMCSDLILGLYVVSIGKDTDELIKFKDSLNFSALNGKIKFAESELKFYTSLGHKEQADSISRNLSDLKS